MYKKPADLIISEVHLETYGCHARELELLLLLARRPGKVYTREEIFKQIWGESRPVNLRNIDVYINKLREKIGPAYIQTLRGVGYKFVLPRN